MSSASRYGSGTRGTARSSRTDDVIVAIDETPVGVYVEIEGSEHGIEAAAAALGRTAADYIVDSYRALFLQERERLGTGAADMMFDTPA